MKKSVSGIILVFVLLINMLNVPVTVQAKENKFLVLVQTVKNGTWTAMEGASYKDEKGGILVSSNLMCEMLDLEYKNTSTGYSINRDGKKITFVKGSYDYWYNDGTKSVKKGMPCRAYDYIYYPVLKDLSISVKYYGGSEAWDYGAIGYKAVVCYSTAGEISAFPDLENIYDYYSGETFFKATDTVKKAPLVLLQTKKDGVWTSYDNISAVSEDGYIMVNPLALAKELGLEHRYQPYNNWSTITLGNFSKGISFERNKNEYTVRKALDRTVKTAKAPMYTKMPENLDMVHYATLGSLVHIKYYSGDDIKNYETMGYDSIICYSTVGKITDVPDSKKIVKSKGIKKYKDKINIGGVDIPKLSSFAAAALKDANWGQDVWEYGYKPLEDALGEYSAQMRMDVMALNDSSNGGVDVRLLVIDNVIMAQINGDSMMTALRLYKEDDYYKIYISTRLSKNPNKGQRDYSTIGQNVLKLFCAIVSSEPEELSYAIYDSWEEDEKYGINKKSWVTVGDCQVMYQSGDHNGYYLIKGK